jgi:predicted RNase H-like nuclease (RuvC/YqgF family)
MAQNEKNSNTKNKKQSVYTIIIAIVAVILCFPSFFAGRYFSARSEAKGRLNEVIADKQEEYDALSAEKESIDADISSLTQAVEDGSDINVKIKTDEETIESLNSQLEEAKAKATALDEELARAKEQSSQLDSVSSSADGKSQTLKADTYNCPKDITAGTYKISGSSGNIIVYDISNSIRISKNLANLDGNEYTFTISEGEKLKVDKEVKLTSTK